MMVFVFLSFNYSFSKGYQPDATNITASGATTICQFTPHNVNAVVGGDQCNGSGGGATESTGSIQWYVNTVNSTVGGTAVGAPIAYTTNEDNTTTWPYSIDPSNSGTFYFYFIITWDDNLEGSPCGPGTVTSNTVEVIITAGPTQANAGTDQSPGDCSTTVTMSANEITVGTGEWTVSPAGPTPQAPFTINDEDAIFENLVAGTEYTFTWTSTNGGCSTSDDMFFNSVGPGCATYCNPAISPGSATAGQITNVTINGVGGINNTTAGANDGHQNFFPGTSTTLVAGATYTLNVTATAYGGMFGGPTCLMAYFDWNGDGDFSDPGEAVTLGTIPSATAFPGLMLTTEITVPCDAVLGGTVMFRIVNFLGACPAASCPASGNGQVESYAMIINPTATPVASAGPDQTITCTSSATLDASASVPGDGFWSLVSGTGTITDPSDPNSTVTGMSNGTSVFQWTAEGTCATDEDIVSIDVSGLPNEPVSAGGDIFTCTQGETLNGSDPAPYTGEWVVTSQPGGSPVVTFSPSNTDPNASVSGLQNGIYTIEWQVNTGGTCGIVTDVMTIDFGSLPAPNAGLPQTVCPSGAVMDANDFTGATGTWSVASEPAGSNAGFVDVNDPNTLVYGLEVGSYDLEWTVSAGGCTGTPSDIVTITVDNCTENITHDPSSDQVFTGCNYTYTDDGGASGDYSNNINQTWTRFCPDDPNAFATLTLTAAAMLTYDYLVIYDEDAPGAPIIGGIWNGQAHPGLGTTITSSTGCLYVQANSNASSVTSGWEAEIGCSATPGVQTTEFVQVNNCGGGGGITVCASGPITAESNTNENPPDLGNQNQDCLGSQEGSSNTWVYINAEADGWISFELDPPGGQDYDYAIWGPYDGGFACPGYTRDEPIRCSWAANGGSGCNSVIGLGIENMDGIAVAPGDVSEGGFCDPTVNEGWTYPIYATAGEVYVLLFQNYGNNNSTFDFALNNDPSSIPPGENFASLGCDPITPLPIQLISFEGEHQDRVNEITWSTASESENAYFIIEKSIDGKEWEELTKVQGAGFSTDTKNYNTLDQNPSLNVTYYRLYQVDFDGTNRIYKTISVVTNGDTEELFGNLYPNPTEDEFYFTYSGNNYETAIELEVVNSYGQVILTKNYSSFNNSLGLNVDVRNLSKGPYMVRVKQGDTIEVKRLIVM